MSVDRKGPRVNVPGVYRNHITDGTEFSWRRFLGSQYDGDRNLYDALGYKDDLEIGDYVAKYKRGPGIARAIVDKPVHDCWRSDITITETESSPDEETEFERKVREFLSGEHTRLKPSARFKTADRWARLLEFSLILIGVSDDGVADGGPEALENPVVEDSIGDLSDIDYLTVYDQRRVNWDETVKVKDPTDPRYRLPKTYNVDIDDSTSVDIHHSRIVHVVENPGEKELRSDPVYKPIFNRLEDLQKLLGGSAEMFWRSAYPGLVLTPPTDADGVPMKFDDDGDSVADEIADYRKNLDRLMRVTGNLEKLDTTVASPESQIDVQIGDISAYIDIPMSIIKGNETGERATSEDRAMYHEFVAGRQTEHCEIQILRSVIDRLLKWGAFPPTTGDETNAYDVEYSALDEPSEKEQAETALTWAKAFEKAGKQSASKVATPQERRKLVLDLDPEMGSEAPDAVDPEELAAERVEVPEDEL